MAIDSIRSADGVGSPLGVATRPVDPVVFAADVAARLELNHGAPGPLYDRRAVIAATVALLAAMDYPTVGEAESTAVARRVAGLAPATGLRWKPCGCGVLVGEECSCAEFAAQVAHA